MYFSDNWHLGRVPIAKPHCVCGNNTSRNAIVRSDSKTCLNRPSSNMSGVSEKLSLSYPLLKGITSLYHFAHLTGLKKPLQLEKQAGLVGIIDQCKVHI